MTPDFTGFTPEFLLTWAGQVLAVTLLVAFLRKAFKDRVPTLWFALGAGLVVFLPVAFWAKLPADAQTAIITVLNVLTVVSMSFLGNEAIARYATRADGVAAASAYSEKLFRPYSW